MNSNHSTSGIIWSDISDHLPIVHMYNNTYQSFQRRSKRTFWEEIVNEEFIIDPITENEIELELKGLKKNKSLGYAGINCGMAKIAAKEIA